MAYNAWQIIPEAGSVFCIGSGPTLGEAWRNAGIQTKGIIEMELRQHRRENP